MIEYQLDPITWFSERELTHTPKHFIVTSHPCTEESKQWVLNEDGEFAPAYDKFEKSIATLPRRNVDSYLKEHILLFIEALKKS